MKIKLFTLILIIVAISCKKDTKPKSDQNLDIPKDMTKSATANGEHCFTYIMKNTANVDGEEFIEQSFVTVNLTIINDKTVRGEYKVTSSKGEANDDYFEGTLDENIITAIQTYKRGSETLKDEMVFKIEANKISILGGEKKIKDGVNMFVDKSQCDYMMELPRVECD